MFGPLSVKFKQYLKRNNGSEINEFE